MSKRGLNIYKRKDGRWEGRIFFQNGKYKSVYAKTYSLAKQKLSEERLRVRSQARGRDDADFSEVVRLWLEASRQRVKESSFRTYFDKIDKHIAPYFAGKKYSDVGCSDVSRFCAKMLSEGFCESYVRDMVTIIKSAAKWYSKMYGAADNLVWAAVPTGKSKAPEILERRCQARLYSALCETNDLTSTGIELCMFTGLRIGELCALKWENINLDEGLISVCHTVQRISCSKGQAKTKLITTDPKTASSVRLIPIPPFLIPKLEKIASADNTYLLSGTERLVEPRCLSYRFKAILKRAGLPNVKFHSLRHSFATNCLQQNFDVKTLSEILGHANANITLKVYAHSSLERKRACMQLVKPFVADNS